MAAYLFLRWLESVERESRPVLTSRSAQDIKNIFFLVG